MPYVKKQFSLSLEQNEFIDSMVRKKSFKDKSNVVRYRIRLIKQQFQDMELREMAKDYSNDHDFVQIGKRGVKLQDLSKYGISGNKLHAVQTNLLNHQLCFRNSIINN